MGKKRVTYHEQMTYDGNRLTAVSEAAPDYDATGTFEYKGANGSEYLYDSNGSLIADRSRGIAYISYDGNGNPKCIYFTNGYMTQYTYSATGQKLAVEHSVALPNVTWEFGVKPNTSHHTAIFAGHTDYLLGGSLIVQEGTTRMLLFDGGYAKAERTSPTSATYGYTLFYYTQDHLGNNREVISASGALKQKTNYYPFGAIITDISSSQDFQPYKYNGKELDRMHGLDTYDYGARQYYSILGRWDRMDPLCEKYYSLSPYVYCHNNPFMRIDPNGKDDYRFDSSTGTFYLMEKTEDKIDRVCGYHYNKKTGQYQKNEGLFSSKVLMTNIEKGILADGVNLKDKDLLISVGGGNGPSIQGVKEFALDFSELINREISGLGYSADGSGNISDIVIGKYNKNTYTSSYCNPTAIANKYKDSFSQTNIFLSFHTHPEGKLGATQSNPEMSQDIQFMRKAKENAPNAAFIILYRQLFEMEEYDYTKE